MVIDEFGFNEFHLAITQQCNLACRHCLRGDARNKTIEDDTINNALKSMDFIGCLLLTGGEVLLHPEKLLEVNKAILKNKIDVYRISIVTNGTIWNNDIKSALLTLNTTPKNSYQRLILGISCDEFHKEEIKRLGLKDHSHEIVEWGKDNNLQIGLKDVGMLVRRGRAKTLEKKDIPQAKYAFRSFSSMPTKEKERARFINPELKFLLSTHVNVDGSVGGMETDWNYFDNQENILFNVNDMSFKDYINSQPEIRNFKELELD